MDPLTFPLVGKENRPILDAAGKLVSIPEHAPMFVAATNLVARLAEMTDSEIEAMDKGRLCERARQIMEQTP